jgi:hypothetical protein
MNKILVLIFVFLISFIGFSQEKVKSDSYIIITFRYDRTNDNHPAKDYHWITSIDSIKDANNFNFYPLYFDEFSNEDLKECKEQRDVNIFTMHKGEDFILEKPLTNDIEILKGLVQLNKKKVQTVIKKWKSGYKEKITVCITPIFGNFCSSNIAKYSGKDIDYEGVIYLPLSNFKLNTNFFKTEDGKLVERLDYLKNNFFNKI